MDIRLASNADAPGIWAVIEPAVRGGETWALPRDWSRDEALAYWFSPDKHVFVAEADGRILGSHFVRTNQLGPGSHVANGGYMTHPEASGRGIAQAMGRHSLDWARAQGFRAMQFNYVVSTNERAVRLWRFLGFEIVGTLPGAFRHPRLGYVDVFVMYQPL